MLNNDILIKNACVITAAGPVYQDGFVHIKGSQIAAVGSGAHLPATRAARRGGRGRPGAQVIDAGGRYVLPGLINPHMHLYSALARGVGVGRMKTFGEVLKALWWKLDRALSLEDIYVSALLGGVDAIKAGVTTLIDHHASYGAISGSLGAVSEALGKIGVRASLCFEISDRAGKSARDEAVAESGLWLETVSCNSEGENAFMQRGMVGLHASMTLSDDTLSDARELMDIYGVGAHVHVAEGIEDVKITRKRNGLTPVARFAKKGILRPGTLAVHCVHVDDKDLSLLKESGAFVIHNPMSNLNNAVGIAPVLRMCGLGIPVAIGTDGMSAGVACDIRAASVLHKPAAGDAQAGWAQIERAVWKTAPEIASGMFGVKVGVIEKGAAADVIIVDAIPPTPVTSGNAFGHFLFGILNSPIRTTIVAGDIRMKDFRIKGIDEMVLSLQATRLAKRLWKRI